MVSAAGCQHHLYRPAPGVPVQHHRADAARIIINDIHASTLRARDCTVLRPAQARPRYSGVVRLRAGERLLVPRPRAVGRTFNFATRKRDIQQDPAYGLEQLEMLAWTEISSAKQNPEVGVRAIHSLRDLLSRWMIEDVEVEDEDPLPMVYVDDLVRGGLDVLESLGAAALESQQHQVLAEVLRTVNLLFDRLTPDLRDRAEELVLRLLGYLDKQFLTRELDIALFQVALTMEMLGEVETAEAIRDAREEQAPAFDFPAGIVGTASEIATGTAREPGFRGEGDD